MDSVKELRINLGQKFSNKVVRVEKRDVFKLFSTCSFISRSGQPFKLKSILASGYNYSVKDLETILNSSGIVKCTFYYPKGDERPFMLSLETEDNKTKYFGIKKYEGLQFEPLDELNNLDAGGQKNLLLKVLKDLFKKVFESVLRISAEKIRFGVTYDEKLRYDIIMSGMFIIGFDVAHIKPSIAHSLAKIVCNGVAFWFEKDLTFVKELYFYYMFYDKTTPLLIHTHDYEIGDDEALHNYYKRERVGGSRWYLVEGASDLKEPKCKGDLKRILREVVETYSTHPVVIDIHRMTKRIFKTRDFDGVPFEVFIQSGLNHEVYWYKPKLSDFFYLDSLVLDTVLQIDTESFQYAGLWVYSSIHEEQHPMLLCLMLHQTMWDGRRIYHWYMKDANGDAWTRIQFKAKPDEYFQKIDDLIQSYYKTDFPSIILSGTLIWLGVFTLGGLVGGLIGMRFGPAIRRLWLRMLRYARLGED